MHRVLDIDLDFFVFGTAYPPAKSRCRLSSDEYEVWPIDSALEFLASHCGLTGPLPGCAVERHDAVFFKWRGAIDAGVLAPQFHVTHVDAHADLGAGDNGYDYLLTELLHRPVEHRHHPRLADEDGWGGMGEGNYLAFAIACRWLSDLNYVIGGRHQVNIEVGAPLKGRPTDLMRLLMEDFDLDAGALRFPVLDPKDLAVNRTDSARLRPLAWEPRVPFAYMYGQDFQASQPFDFIYLARSPRYTPGTADDIYDAIYERFIDRNALKP
jgi:UPF0489 domain